MSQFARLNLAVFNLIFIMFVTRQTTLGGDHQSHEHHRHHHGAHIYCSPVGGSGAPLPQAEDKLFPVSTGRFWHDDENLSQFDSIPFIHLPEPTSVVVPCWWHRRAAWVLTLADCFSRADRQKKMSTSSSSSSSFLSGIDIIVSVFLVFFLPFPPFTRFSPALQQIQSN